MRFCMLLVVFAGLLSSCSISGNTIDNGDVDPFTTTGAGECQTICWLGIEPLVTRKQDALKLLQASDHVDASSIEVSDNGVDVTWYTNKDKDLHGYVYIEIDANEIVHSIKITYPTGYTLGLVVDIFGEPDKISITKWQGVHGENFTNYIIYYDDNSFFAYIPAGSQGGPDPNDAVELMGLNLPFGDIPRQPWLGFDHVESYIP